MKSHVPAVPAGLILCLLFAVGCIGFGLLFASQATLGVCLVGAGCFLAICGRIVQAGQQQKELLATLAQPNLPR